MNKDQLQKRLLETFKIEADEHLCSIADGLLKIEKNPSREEAINITEVLHREVHSLKGAARAVNLQDAELICQTMEKIFSAWKRQELKTNQQQLDHLHKAVILLQQAIVKSDIENIIMDKHAVTEITACLNNLTLADAPAAVAADVPDKNHKITAPVAMDYMTQMQTVRIASSKLDSLLLKTEEMLIVKLVMQKYVHELFGICDTIKILKNDWNKILRGKSAQSVDAFLANGFDRIKSLENSLTLLRSEFEIYGRQFNVLIDGLLDDAKDMVLLPFATLLDSFPMMVRNIAHEQGKSINLLLEGSEIEIDKRILDELKDPLIHLLRNSIDHGIEKPEERSGKNPEGTIKVIISQFNANEIVITISDDGRGIDVQAVKKAAVKQGMLSPQDAESIGDQEALSLICLSGVSTSPIITSVSGHGLGMAIVYEKIEKIGGHIDLKSQKNVGTEIKLTLPLSLTTFRGVLLRSGGQLFVLPTAHIERIIRIRPEDIKTIENKATILLDEATLSLIRLDEVLGILSQTENLSGQNYHTAVVIHIGDNRAAFQIDEIYGEQEVLVKKLSAPLLRVKYVTAATILETGVPVPILSANDLIKSVMKDLLPQRFASSVANNAAIQENKTILVVEDSITTRMLLKNILEMVGYTVITAVDGADAWRILREQEVSLVVSDVEMPRMNGFELTQNIRSDKKLSELPVVLVTTRDSQQDREHGIDVGANAYIVKSNFEDDNLTAVIKRLI